MGLRFDGMATSLKTGGQRVTGVTLDPMFLGHVSRQGCPESPSRYLAALAGIRRVGHGQALLELVTRDATIEELTRCHDPAYVELVERECAEGRYVLSTGDVDLAVDSYAVARRAAGACMSAVDAVLAGDVTNAFCPVRPPGHHAVRSAGLGFCLFSNVALAARHAQEAHGVERVLSVDWDAHHGNGTQEMFYEDGSVYYFSTHQWPSFPGTGLSAQRGLQAGRGMTLNCPLGIGSGWTEIRQALSQLAREQALFKPELVLIG